jgi:hypothetical protein
MPRKKELSADDFLAIMKRVMEAPEMPIPEYLFDLDIMDIDVSAFPPPLSSVLGKKPFSPDTMLPVSGSRSICIRVPARVIRSYKLQAAATGRCYQTLMNRALAEAAKGHL